jgi:hypothetical protein
MIGKHEFRPLGLPHDCHLMSSIKYDNELLQASMFSKRAYNQICTLLELLIVLDGVGHYPATPSGASGAKLTRK